MQSNEELTEILSGMSAEIAQNVREVIGYEVAHEQRYLDAWRAYRRGEIVNKLKAGSKAKRVVRKLAKIMKRSHGAELSGCAEVAAAMTWADVEQHIANGGTWDEAVQRVKETRRASQ